MLLRKKIYLFHYIVQHWDRLSHDFFSWANANTRVEYHSRAPYEWGLKSPGISSCCSHFLTTFFFCAVCQASAPALGSILVKVTWTIQFLSVYSLAFVTWKQEQHEEAAWTFGLLLAKKAQAQCVHLLLTQPHLLSSCREEYNSYLDKSSRASLLPGDYSSDIDGVVQSRMWWSLKLQAQPVKHCREARQTQLSGGGGGRGAVEVCKPLSHIYPVRRPVGYI